MASVAITQVNENATPITVLHESIIVNLFFYIYLYVSYKHVT